MADHNKKIISWIRKIKWYHLLFVAASILIVSAVLRALTPTPPPAATVISEQNRAPGDPEISFEEFVVDIPDKLTVLRAEVSPEEIETEFAKKMATRLNYQEVQTIENTWVDAGQTSSISVETLNNNVSYKNYYDPTQIEAIQKTHTKDQLKQILNDFLTTQVGITNYSFIEEIPILFTNEAIETSTDSQANGYRFTVAQLVDNIPLVIGTRRSQLASAVVIMNGDILRANFFPRTITTEVVETYNPLSLDAIKNNLDLGLVNYLTVSSTTSDNTDPAVLTQITFTKGSLEYRQNEANGYILPYIKFTGTGKDSKNREYYVEAISPAIRVE